MADVLFLELGFPVLLVHPRMVEIRGEQVPDVNMAELQEAVFRSLAVCSARLTGAQLRFVRKHLRLRQTDLAEVLNIANHSVVSQWESKEDGPTGMAYNTEVVLRLWMAAKAGMAEQPLDLLERRLKGLSPHRQAPLEIELPQAA
jgi:DNA-binding transcriptional regulator YiaG